jgi:hypothetical protein
MRNSARCRALAVLLLLVGGCSTPPAAPTPAPSAETGPLAPSYPDVTAGDSETAAQLHAFDPQAQSAVIEPTIFLTGPDFCESLRIDPADPRCEREWVTEDSHLKVTLPVSPDAKLLTMRDGDPECLGSMAKGGTCPLTPRQFTALLGQADTMLVHVTVRGGQITRIAEEYTP